MEFTSFWLRKSYRSSNHECTKEAVACDWAPVWEVLPTQVKTQEALLVYIEMSSIRLVHAQTREEDRQHKTQYLQ